jgi:hypothetical protein
MSLPPPASSTVSVPLATGGKMKRLLGKKGEHRLTLTPQEILVEHGDLRAPLRFAPGSVAVAAVDPGPGEFGRDPVGRFPILRRLSATTVVPRSEGIEGWAWTSTESSALTALTDEAPNVLFIFSPPLPAERIQAAFSDEQLAEIAKRSPLGQPALFGLLLRAEKVSELSNAFDRYGFRSDLTDREMPPVQRRHLPDDKAANPNTGVSLADRVKTSMPPPGVS